jgi:hypothetical protein
MAAKLYETRSNFMIPADILKDAFDGYDIYDCAVRRRDSFSFLGIKRAKLEKDQKRKIITVFLDANPRFGDAVFTGFVDPSLAVSKFPKEQVVMVALDGGVAVLGGGDGGMEEPIPRGPDAPLNGGANNLTTIEGYVYVAGSRRRVCYREGSNKWVSISANLPDPEKGTAKHAGFDAISGFSREDIYGVGGKGDAWRYDGKKWHRCALPTNMYLESVCCAGDDYVYIGLQSGGVMRGRKDEWEIVHEDTMTLPFEDMVWFDGRVWCTSDYGIWTVENGKFKEPDLPPEVKACSGNLSVADGVMLVAGMYGAAVYDGKKWDRLF